METHLGTSFDGLPLAQKRALLELQGRMNWLEPYAPETVVAAMAGEIPWANAEGISPHELDTYLAAAERLLEVGRWDDASAILSYVASVDSTSAVAYLGLGVIALERRDMSSATAFFNAAIDCFGGDMGAHAGRAIAHMESGNFLAACEDMAHAIDHDPDGNLPLTLRMAAMFKDVAANDV